MINLPRAEGHTLLPNKLVRNSERTMVDLPSPDSPSMTERERERERESKSLYYT